VPVAINHGPLRLEVSSRDNGVAHFCVALKVVETPL